jgi:hypothetical protein
VTRVKSAARDERNPTARIRRIVKSDDAHAKSAIADFELFTKMHESSRPKDAWNALETPFQRSWDIRVLGERASAAPLCDPKVRTNIFYDDHRFVDETPVQPNFAHHSHE